MSQTVIGIFENTAQAQEAKAYLLANGFSNDNIDLNTPDHKANQATGSDNGVGNRISEFFKGLFKDQDDAASHISAGENGTIVTVHANAAEEAEKAAEVLNDYGAMDVNEYNERAGNENVAQDSIKVINEELQVGKREVETGGMRLRSRIIERPVEERIRLREEHVNIERNTVDRPATEADFSNFKEGTVELTEHAERPVVAKTARVVEEVSLGKEVSEREEVIKDTVRHTEVDTEDIPGVEERYSKR